MSKIRSISSPDLLFAEFEKHVRFAKRMQCMINEKGCWEIISHKPSSSGYVSFNGCTPRIGAHRLAYQVSKGDIPHGLCIRHSCDNKLCVNPEHLSVGTLVDNVRDRCERGRTRVPYGELHGAAKLTTDEVKGIYLDTTSSRQELCEKYNISYGALRSIINNINWKHLTATLPMRRYEQSKWQPFVNTG